jgi:hypothetical protein
MSDAPPAKRRAPGLAVYALAASYGLAGALVTGDWGKGMAVAALAFGILLVIFLGFPRQVRSESRPYLLHALLITVSPFVALKLGLARTAWVALEERYVAAGEPAAEFSGGGEVIIVEQVDEFMIRPSEFKGIATAFGEGGAYLAPRWPIRMVYKPLRFPLASISACADSQLDTGFTAIRLAGTGAQVEVLDADRRVLEWCRRHGKPESAPGS